MPVSSPPAPTLEAPSSALSSAPSTPPPSRAPVTSASAQRDLAPFVDAARDLDRRLHAAAALINTGVHADAVVVDRSTAAAVQGLDLGAVGSAIPGALPRELMRRVLTTYSDLVSRTLAMSPFRFADRTYTRIPPEGTTARAEGEDMVLCLGNGTVAAQRFDADLAAVVTAAGSTPPLPTVDPASLARAEVDVRLAEIVLRNRGCGACGGFVQTEVSTIVWDQAPASATTRTGALLPEASAGDVGGGLPFTAVYTPGTGWSIDILAC
ncbi:hypothetical protein [Cellulomonas sp. SG140]|uniref:hypothetical protein n=1 Tax=Cellulomonas sp. SG140 TaxID=2976536 RepID=UPI0021E98ED4|nr:hypothetical protein [Cellulomonas sp. SG140]